MEKIDLYKRHKQDYIAPNKPSEVDVASADYLTIQGQGAPGGKNFENAVSALYAVAYTVKMTRKKHGLGDYVICKLEARYWSETGQSVNELPQSQWHWQLMIRTPAQVQQSDVKQAITVLLAKGKTATIANVKLIDYEFGQCVQMLHLGPYEEEGRTIDEMTSYAKAKKLAIKACHSEVYLSDPRRIPANRLKTIIRLFVDKEIT